MTIILIVVAILAAALIAAVIYFFLLRLNDGRKFNFKLRCYEKIVDQLKRLASKEQDCHSELSHKVKIHEGCLRTMKEKLEANDYPSILKADSAIDDYIKKAEKIIADENVHC